MNPFMQFHKTGTNVPFILYHRWDKCVSEKNRRRNKRMSEEIKDMLQAIIGRLDEQGTILKAVRGRLEEQGAEIKGINERLDRQEGELKRINTRLDNLEAGQQETNRRLGKVEDNTTYLAGDVYLLKRESK
jgi:predicted nuclease with TOPRIM domain